MNNSKIAAFILVSAVILLGTLSCNSPESELQEQKKLLSVYLKTFTKMDHPVFHKTLSKEEVAEYLKGGFSMREIGFLSIPPDSLEIFFDESVINAIAEKTEHYEQLTLTEELTLGHSIVTEKDIPDHIKNNAIPPPFNYTGIQNVYFLSTPLIYNNTAILFLDSFGETSVGITIIFFKKGKNDSWELIDKGTLMKAKYRE